MRRFCSVYSSFLPQSQRHEHEAHWDCECERLFVVLRGLQLHKNKMKWRETVQMSTWTTCGFRCYSILRGPATRIRTRSDVGATFQPPGAVSAPAFPNKEEYFVPFLFAAFQSKRPCLLFWVYVAEHIDRTRTRHSGASQPTRCPPLSGYAGFGAAGVRTARVAVVPLCLRRRVFLSAFLLAVSACLLNVKPGGSRWLIKGAARSLVECASIAGTFCFLEA